MNSFIALARRDRHVRGNCLAIHDARTAAGRCVLAATLALLLVTTTAPAQQSAVGRGWTLSLEQAVALAQRSSDAVDMAIAHAASTSAHRLQVRSSRLPQVGLYSTFDRAIRSEYEGLDFGSATTTAPADASDNSVDLPFGAPNSFRTGVVLSQALFTGGAAVARSRAAASRDRAANMSIVAARAELALDVADAYFDLALNDQLIRIAEGSLAQAESTLSRAALVLKEGRGSQFDYLRAKVARDRAVPSVIRQHTARDLAKLRLALLVHVSPDEELELVTGLDAEEVMVTVRPTSFAKLLVTETVASTASGERLAVRAATESLRERDALVTAARAARWPTLSLQSTFEEVGYSRSGLPAWRGVRTNWTAGLRVELPLLTGGARRGVEEEAQAERDAARAALRQTERLAQLDARAAAAKLAAASAAWEATQGGVREAARAYEIALLRQREGLAIQLEVTDARLALEQASGERARAARDLLMERARSALLPDLPLASLSTNRR